MNHFFFWPLFNLVLPLAACSKSIHSRLKSFEIGNRHQSQIFGGFRFCLIPSHFPKPFCSRDRALSERTALTKNQNPCCCGQRLVPSFHLPANLLICLPILSFGLRALLISLFFSIGPVFGVYQVSFRGI